MCFNGAWWLQLFIYVILVCAAIAILRIIVPYVFSKMRPSAEVAEGIGVVTQVLRVVVWAIVIIFVLYLCYALWECLVGFSGGSLLPRVRG